MTSSLRPPSNLLYHPVYARLLCDTLAQRGIPRERVLQDAGLQLADIDYQAGHLDHARFNALLRAARRHCPDPLLPFEWGSSARETVHGMPGTAIMCSRDLRQALGTLCQLISLRGSTFRGELQESDGQVRLSFSDWVSEADLHDVITCALSLLLVRMLAALLGAQADQLGVELPVPLPAAPERIAGYFPGPVRFAAPTLCLTLPANLLDLPCPGADAHTHAAALRQCELDLLGLQGDLASRLRAHLARCQLEYPTLDDCARLLCLSPRSLSRALQHAGTSYQQLLDETRQAQACEWLQATSLSIEQIAWRLGYSDPSNFVRAFRRWQGCTPQAWRRPQRAS